MRKSLWSHFAGTQTLSHSLFSFPLCLSLTAAFALFFRSLFLLLFFFLFFFSSGIDMRPLPKTQTKKSDLRLSFLSYLFLFHSPSDLIRRPCGQSSLCQVLIGQWKCIWRRLISCGRLIRGDLWVWRGLNLMNSDVLWRLPVKVMEDMVSFN